MNLRITLTDPLGATKIISEPGGWDSSSIGLERHPQLLSLIEYFKASFQTYGSNGTEDGGRDWILAREKTFGPDALIGVLVEIDPNDSLVFRTLYSGNLGIGLFVETLDQDHLLQIVFANSDFWSKIMARWQTEVDLKSVLDLDGNAVIATPSFTLPLPSQKIIKKYQAEQKYNQCIDFSEGTFDSSVWARDLQIDFDTVALEEISQTLHYGINPLNPSNTGRILPFAKFILTEDGDFTINNFNITLSTLSSVGTGAGSSMLGKENRTFSTITFFKIIIQINSTIVQTLVGADRAVANYNRNDGKAIILLTNTVTDYSFSGSLGILRKNDQVRIYGQLLTPVAFNIHVNQGQPFGAAEYRGLMVWGSAGWNKDTFCPFMGAENNVGATTPYIDARFTSLIDAGYDPLVTSGSGGLVANVLTGFPVFRTGTIFGAGGSFTDIDDAFVLALDGTILGSGIFAQAYNKGTYLQVKYIQTGTGTISCNTANNAVIGIGTNFNIVDHPIGSVINISGGPFDPTRWIGQILSVDSTTHITLATNAGHTFVNEDFSIIEFYIAAISLYEGLEAFGDTSIDITFNSSMPETSTEAFLTHDVIAGTIDRISGRPGLFYSEYFGNPWTSRIYAATGCGSLKGNMKGLHVRGYSLADKPYAKSAQDWHEGVNPIDCIGLGYEKRLGVDVIRCERAPYFFDDSSMSILFSNVQNIKRSYDSNWQFNSIDYGYEKWQSQAASGVGSPSGIDDPQSQGTRNTIFKIIGKKFKIMSKWLAASLAIETMRRLASLLSANYTYDDDVVVIYLHSNGDGTFTPELDENYSSITNLSNKETRYNTTISSTRNFLRWRTYLSGCLQPYPASSFKFVPGQGNYTMTSTRTTICDGDETGEVVSENGDVAIGEDFLFIPMPFEIQHFMDFDDYETLVANKNLSIGISQTNVDHKPFFIDKLDYQIATGLVKCIAWPKIPFDIVVPDTGSSVEAGGFKYFEEPYHEKQFE